MLDFNMINKFTLGKLQAGAIKSQDGFLYVYTIRFLFMHGSNKGSSL